MTRTRKGSDLARKLQSLPVAHGNWNIFIEVCSKICRHANTLHRVNETTCSVELSEAQNNRLQIQEDEATYNVSRHCQTLTALAGIEIRPHFNGDPRGPAVKLTLPEPWRHLYDCFGGEGVCVP